MYDYALIIHPTNEELLHKYEPGMKNKPRILVKKVLEWMSPFLAAEVTGLHSHLGRTARGALVMCPLLMEQMTTLSPHKVFKSVMRTLEFAQGLGPKIIGLTAYTAFSGNKGADIAKVFPTPLTTGANYSMAMIPEAILRGLDFMEQQIGSSNVLVIGGNSGVARYCIEILAQFSAKVYVNVHNDEKFNIFFSTLSQEKKSRIARVKELNTVLDKVNIVVMGTNRFPPDFDLRKLHPGCVVYDASYPRRVNAKARNDILVIDGVTVEPPGKTDFCFDFGLPKGLCYPCMAEPMILALERKFEDYSLGKEFDVGKIRDIVRLGAKHGFSIHSLTSQDRPLTHDDIFKIRDNALERKRRKKRKFFLLWR